MVLVNRFLYKTICSDDEYEYAVQTEIKEYREQLAYKEAFTEYCKEEYKKEQLKSR